MTPGAALKAYRERMGYTIRQMANKLRVSASAICRLETGKARCSGRMAIALEPILRRKARMLIEE
jgi:transcriptional regulator with XRE-family HTH domain